MKTSLGFGLALSACIVVATACSPSAGDAGSGDAGGGGTANPDGGTQGDGAAPVPSSPPATAAECDALGAAMCKTAFTCSPFSSKLFTDEATCAARQAASCKAHVAAPGSGYTSAATAACTAAMIKGSCADLFTASGTPTACSFNGSRAVDAACGVDEQCASGKCTGGAGICGACAAAKAAGEACTGTNECDRGLFCDAADTCTAKVAAGAACSERNECAGTNVCVGGTCTTPLALGADCTASSNGCDIAAGHMCDGSKKCAALVFAAPGAPCGVLQNDYVLCAAGNHCKVPAGKATGTCTADAALGQACGDDDDACGTNVDCVEGVCGHWGGATCK